MEALDPGRPLSFLDAHIKCGNSPARDDRRRSSPRASPTRPSRRSRATTRRSRRRSASRTSTSARASSRFEDLADRPRRLARGGGATRSTRQSDDTLPRRCATKERRFAELGDSEAYERARLAHGCLVRRLRPAQGRRMHRGSRPDVVRRIACGRRSRRDGREEVRRLAAEYAFFHWEVEYPRCLRARTSGGFDVVLGNPPWERVKLQEKEFFAAHPEIRHARSTRPRTKEADRCARGRAIPRSTPLGSTALRTVGRRESPPPDELGATTLRARRRQHVCASSPS